MAWYDTIFNRVSRGIRNLFGRGEQPPPPPRQRPTAPRPSILPRPQPSRGYFPTGPPETGRYFPIEETPPTEGPFGFPEDLSGDQYTVDFEPYEVDAEQLYQMPGTIPIQGDEVYWGTPNFWYDEVSTKDKYTLLATYGVSNVGIIKQMAVLGYWDDSTGSEDWRRFREEYIRQFGYTDRFSPEYGR